MGTSNTNIDSTDVQCVWHHQMFMYAYPNPNPGYIGNVLSTLECYVGMYLSCERSSASIDSSIHSQYSIQLQYLLHSL